MSVPPFQLWPSMRRVENAAWSAIVRCVRARRLETIPVPIPVEEWIEGPLGIRLTISDLTALGQNVLGVARPAEREIEISQSLVEHEGRLRFTAAHELGHVLLHARLTGFFRDSEGNDYLDRRVEREADRFAAAFLMPIPALCQELTVAAASLRSGPEAMLAAVARGESGARETFQHQVVPLLAERFSVSTAAAVRRFSDVQLPSGVPALPFEVGLSLLSPLLVQEALRQR